MSQVRDYSNRADIVAAVHEARDTIIAWWDEWDAEAGMDAECKHDNDAWSASMNAQLECVLFGMLDQIPISLAALDHEQQRGTFT
jgi:hypothetical protein